MAYTFCRMENPQLALQQIYEIYKAKRQQALVAGGSDAAETTVAGFSQSLVDTFENGLAVDVVTYRLGYDRLTHAAYECNSRLT